MVSAEVAVPTRSEADIVLARQRGRAIAEELGFSSGDGALIATAISEITRNVIQYGGGGTTTLAIIEDGPHRGICVVVEDHGPGIVDLELAMQDGYTTGGGLGLGLPGSKRLMDEFEVDTAPGVGTRVTMRKWVR